MSKPAVVVTVLLTLEPVSKYPLQEHGITDGDYLAAAEEFQRRMIEPATGLQAVERSGFLFYPRAVFVAALQPLVKPVPPPAGR